MTMTRASCYITNSFLTWIAFVLVACFIVSRLNSANADWSIDLDLARDLEERRCFNRAQSAFDVSFGLANTSRKSAEEYAKIKFMQNSTNGEEDADDVYASEMKIILDTYNEAVRTAESIANDAVSGCVTAGDRREAEREKERAAAQAERERQQRDEDEGEDDYSEDEGENELVEVINFYYFTEDEWEDDFDDDLQDDLDRFMERLEEEFEEDI